MIRMAVPNKGRLSQPSLQLLGDAGLSFELSERSLSVAVRNADLELLMVRTEDVAELVADGAADLGITGQDLLVEFGRDLPTLSELGYGRCRLAAAVPSASPIDTFEALDGLRVATAHPRVTSDFFGGRGISVTVVPLRGSVEVATKLGVADAIVDLVSTGSTMLVNGLREVGNVLTSQAVLVAGTGGMTPPAESLAVALRAVIAARRRRYLLLNTPQEAVQGIAKIIPGLEAPTVVPLAEAGWVAIHSVVDADEVWHLLPRLQAAGAKGILVLPIEQLIP
jgi:ATP phosphoribosyltransferase